MKLIICAIIALLVQASQSFGKEETVRFHLPETEAEKVLSSILMKGDDSSNISTTKAYRLDIKRQLDKAENSKECKEDGGGLSCYPWNCGHLICSQSDPYGFGLYSEKETKTESHIIVEFIWYGDSRTYVKYIMKNEINHIKQDIWKLDGVCCSGRVYINCPYQAPKYSNEEGDK